MGLYEKPIAKTKLMKEATEVLKYKVLHQTDCQITQYWSGEESTEELKALIQYTKLKGSHGVSNQAISNVTEIRVLEFFNVSCLCLKVPLSPPRSCLFHVYPTHA